jgi:tRNA-splicing ligase RtcB
MLLVEKPGMRVPLKAWMDNPTFHDYEVMEQMQRVCSLPWVYHHSAIMADGHVGIGCSVGAVIAMKDAVSPATVGVDLGCGMAAVRTNLVAGDLPESLAQIRADVEDAIPVGFSSHLAPIRDDRWPIAAVADTAGQLWREFGTLHPKVQKLRERAQNQLGTLGGGNHFVELCLDDGGAVWMMLHSGSRNIGKSLAEVHIGIAQRLSHNEGLPDPDLAVFLAGTPEMTNYRRDLFWTQRYATANRRTMLNLYWDVLLRHFPVATHEEPILCHHNYVAEEVHFGEKVFVTRKGAIRAGAGDMGIIPGSMGTGSYIVRGLGNPESFESAPHGAGRKMSRGEAKRRFTQRDVEEQTAGVECRKDGEIRDELPGAYKDIEDVIKQSADLVEVVAHLRQVMCVKG